MKPIHPASALRPLLRTGLAGLLCLLLARCGNYQMTTPVSASQSTPRLTGYPALSGKPALRTPAAIGILTTGRTHALDLHQAKLDPPPVLPSARSSRWIPSCRVANTTN
jgi:hypothetical protein